MAGRGEVTVEILSNMRARIVGLSEKASKVVDDALSMETPNSRFMPQVSAGLWDGRRHLYSVERGTFPCGLVERVTTLLDELDQPYRVADKRVVVPPPCDLTRLSATMLRGVKLRPYQIKAARRALRRQRGVCWMATNSGKSEVSCAIIKALKKRTLFLVHTKPLLSQTRARIAERLGTIEEHIGIIGDGRFEPRQITVGTIQTLTRKAHPAKAKIIAKYLKTIELLIVDEGHHAKATTWYRLLQRIPASYRYCMSGTPFAGDNALLVEAAFGPVVARVSNKTLVKLGVSAKPTITMLPVNEPSIDENSSWQQVHQEGIVNNVTRNGLIAQETERLAKRGEPTMIMINHLWHGDLIREMLKSLRISHTFVHGRMPTSMVMTEKARFEAGKVKVLIASPIFDEGVDAPAIRALVMADSGKSVRKVLQQIGRGLRRKTTGTNTLHVIDFADQTHRWLADHTQERLSIYEAEGFEVVVKSGVAR